MARGVENKHLQSVIAVLSRTCLHKEVLQELV